MDSTSTLSIIGLTLAAAAGTVASIRETAHAQPAVTSSAESSPAGGETLLHFSAELAERSIDQSVVDHTGKIKARIEGAPALIKHGPVRAVRFNGRHDWLTVSPDIAKTRPSLPTREMTVSALVSLEHTQEWGSIIGCLQDNGDEEMGWNLGFGKDAFTFSLASTGTDDGNGRMATITGKTKIELGRWYHVTGVYDGRTMKLYVNGTLEAESSEQSGDILYPGSAPFTIACYKDRNEQHATGGVLLDVKLRSSALEAATIARELEPRSALLAWAPPIDLDQKEVVKPYLQFATQTGMTFMWEPTKPGRGFVEFTETLPFESKSAVGSPGTMHEIRVEGLKPQTPYFWRARTIADDGTELLSDVLTFQTAVTPDNPFMFVVLGDTQRNPAVIKKLQDFSYTLRPNFQIHVGDVVNDGPDKTEWVNEMLPSSWGLMSRVPMFPCIGNHEEDHAHYYQYFSLPDPESWYTYTFGNAQFFVADTNKAIDLQSPQFKWLDAELAKSTATWKIVYHHHPVYSSDEDDYGNTYKEKSTYGHPKHRHLADLYDRHGVDLNFNGHIHCYERSWPLRGGKVVQEGGVIYVTSGGGGGGLERAGPSRSWFAQRVYTGHHITSIMINGKRLSLQAFDLEGRLFDTMELRKP